MSAPAPEQQGSGPTPDPKKPPTPPAQQPAAEPPKTFTQDQVDKMIQSRLKKFADYDDLKAKAEGSKTIEDRLTAAEQRAAKAEAQALRNDIATRHGVSAEDRDLFLTGADEDTLTAQAKRLAERDSERRKQGNVAPNEGGNPTPKSDDPNRQFLKDLLGRDQG